MTTSTEILENDSTLLPGEFLQSENGAYRATFTKDGDLVLTLGESPVWNLGISAKDPTGLSMQSDGNLVAYRKSTPAAYWASHTWNESKKVGRSTYLKLTDAGELFLHQDGMKKKQINGKYKEEITKIIVNEAKYDIKAAKMGKGEQIEGQRITVDNSTDTEQTSSTGVRISTTQTWSHSNMVGGSITVEAGGKAGIPLVAEGEIKVSATAEYQHTWSSSEGTTTVVTATADVTVPPHRTYWAMLVGQKTSISCTYTASGEAVMASGTRRPWSTSGSFEGENGHDFEVHYGEVGKNKAIGQIKLSADQFTIHVK